MTDKNNMPNSKLSRFSLSSKTVLKVIGKHALHKASTTFVSKEKKKKKQTKHYQKLAKEIFKVLSVLKGTALKAAQLISLEHGLLPKEFQEELQKSCYQVPPLNRALIRKMIQSQLKQSPEEIFKKFDLTAFAAASIGQVHKAITKDNVSVAVKIQYPGINQTIAHDMKLLKILLLKLPMPGFKKKPKLISTFLTEFEKRFLDESDYEKEKKNINWFQKKNPFHDIIIPQTINNHCSKTILTMSFLQGDHLDEWLKKAPSQKEKNHYAQTLWNFFIYFFKTHHILHADPNPGNYLFMSNGKLGVLDFGCVKKCDPEFPNQFTTLIKLHMQQNMKGVMEIYNKWGLLPKNLEKETQIVEDHLSYFRQWITLPFSTTHFDFKKNPNYMAQRLTPEFRNVLKIIHNTTHNFVMFDRSYMGILNIFQRLKAQVKMSIDI